MCSARNSYRQPLIDSHEHNIFQPNRIKFECFASSAIELTLKGEKLDLCDEGDSKPNAHQIHHQDYQNSRQKQQSK